MRPKGKSTMPITYNTRYAGFIQGKIDQDGSKFDLTDLNPNFVNAFNKGETHRVKVQFPSGEVIWGFVGVTTGWKPSFLLMRRIGQHGSTLLLGENCKAIDHKTMKRGKGRLR